jgi:hypothetical protein
MKRFTTLALLVFALAAVPAAFADDTTPPAPPVSTTAPTTTPAPTTPATQRNAGSNAGIRLEILRLRMQIVQLRFRLHCGPNGHASPERCKAFVQKLLDRLTKLDATIKAKIDELKACTPASTDPKCRNADKKIAFLTRLDQHVQQAIQRLQNYLDGKSTSDPSSDSALDQAAGQLGQAAGSNG